MTHYSTFIYLSTYRERRLRLMKKIIIIIYRKFNMIIDYVVCLDHKIRYPIIIIVSYLTYFLHHNLGFMTAR